MQSFGADSAQNQFELKSQTPKRNLHLTLILNILLNVFLFLHIVQR